MKQNAVHVLALPEVFSKGDITSNDQKIENLRMKRVRHEQIGAIVQHYLKRRQYLVN